MKQKPTYYHFEDDLKKYPSAWCYVVWSNRGPGKTYSSLKYAYENRIPIVYIKRTNEDVNLICSANDYGFDPSPYKPINRDCGYNIKPVLIKDGIGAFWEMEDGEPKGNPVSYILSCNAIKKFKGFDFSECDWIIFDEFIPQVGEIVKRGEGEMVLDLYRTIARDRQKRGRAPLKLVLFANSESISCPLVNTLEIIDDMSIMNTRKQSYYFNPDRDIMLHRISPEEIPMSEEEQEGIFKAMKHTAWASKSFGNEFQNDFTNIIPNMSIKGYKPFIHIHYKTFDYYVYIHDNGMYYFCERKAKCVLNYDLNLENDQRRFYMEYAIDLRNDCADGYVKFSKYSMYDLLINYKKFFKL